MQRTSVWEYQYTKYMLPTQLKNNLTSNSGRSRMDRKIAFSRLQLWGIYAHAQRGFKNGILHSIPNIACDKNRVEVRLIIVSPTQGT